MSSPTPSLRTRTGRWATLLLLAFTGCAAGNSLTGSVASADSLSFDSVESEWVTNQLVIRYLLSGNLPIPGEPLRLTMDKVLVTDGEDIPAVPGLEIEHYLVTRSPGGELIQDPPLPAVAHGYIHFDRAGSNVGQAVQGNFSLIFVDGSNLDGTFNTSVVNPGS